MAEKLRVLFLNSEFSPADQGADGISSYIFSLAAGLINRGHEVHLLSCLYNLQKERDYTDRGVHIHVRPRIRIPGLLSLLRARRTVRRVDTFVSSFLMYHRLAMPFDVVEYPEWRAEGLLVAASRGVPTVAQLHGPLVLLGKLWGDPNNYDYRWACALERWALRRADRVNLPSKLAARTLNALGWLDGIDWDVIPHPVDLSTWENVSPVFDTAPVVLCIGRLERAKGPDILLQSMGILRRGIPQASAILAGPGTDYHPDEPTDLLRRIADSIGGCEFRGLVPRSELPALIGKARVVVVPSRFEAFSMVAVEAMASGRPVVATETTGIADFMLETGVGRVVPSEDPEALAQAIHPFLEDPEYAMELGVRARQAVKLHLNPDRIAAKKETMYRMATGN